VTSRIVIDAKIRVFQHNRRKPGLGWSFWEGREYAR
jgi:hypothetical protein